MKGWHAHTQNGREECLPQNKREFDEEVHVYMVQPPEFKSKSHPEVWYDGS